MGLPSYHHYRCCQFLLMKLEFFYVEVLADMKTQDEENLTDAGNLANLESNGLKQKTSRASLLGNNTLHLVGLLSDSGVHSRLDQLQLFLNRASECGAKNIRVRVLTDGRDVLDGSSVGFSETLKAEVANLRSKGIDAQVASSGGRNVLNDGSLINLPRGNLLLIGEIKQDEEPTRSTLWLKGRVNKEGEYQDDEIRSVGDKLKETKDKIKEGTLKVDHGTDAMTVVLGKEKGGYAKGVGSGVTYKRYFDLPRSSQASDEIIALL
ncbi:retrovirus-related pol polyprotein from transposon TNT 1-94 [Tanacetum coccineum]